MSELISVLMSTYNENIVWVEQCVDSILNQTYSNLEFIIILDNPNNLLLKQLLFKYEKKDKRVKLIINDSNIGLTKSLNKGLKYCKGKYIARMDADDIAFNSRLEIQKGYLEKNDLDFIFSNVININENGDKLHKAEMDQLDCKILKKILFDFNISIHPTWFLKREIYDVLNGYNHIPYCEDYDFSLRCLNQGYKIGVISEPLLYYRVRENSISRSHLLEQFLITKQISNVHKSNDFNKNRNYKRTVIDSIKNLKDEDKIKYTRSYYKFYSYKEFLNKKNYLKATFYLLNSFFNSKYFFSTFLFYLKRKVMLHIYTRLLNN